MSSSKTSNYDLNQWVKSDRVLMEEFNADNAKIDAALASKASASTVSSLQSAVNGKASASSVTSLSQTVSQGLALRNCRFVTGSYSGDNTYGPDHAITLNFPQKPVFVCVTSESVALTLCMVLGQTDDWVVLGSGGSSLAITWGARSVSWYADETNVPAFAARHQMNDDSNYHYFAILEVE